MKTYFPAIVAAALLGSAVFADEKQEHHMDMEKLVIDGLVNLRYGLSKDQVIKELVLKLENEVLFENEKEAVEKKYGLSGKKFHRVLHLVNTINSNVINFVQNIVPPKYLKSRPDNEILELFQYKDYFDVRNYTRLLNKHITNKERINLYTCLVNSIMNGGSVYTFMDHIKFYPIKIIRQMLGFLDICSYIYV